ncbi:MAG: tRNA (adenosine(37)-N6)-threonylcarbamoyltransferase complex ATPase subunit type 1 TsaE [Proteobacteria bacterium]|nr:tRNA (adenosine(37)-N6)-threonylcarbamoyltransferase complex ATPase subunit type 1 TsaE [Pseudomonadota bacterium]
MAIVCHSLQDTVDFGASLGRLLRAGDVIALRGPLGIGKTQLVRGIAQSYLGEGVRVCSPSFTIINRYEAVGGRVIHHLDLYRLSTLEELESTGYWDSIEDPSALVVIEWLEQVDRAQPIEFVTLCLSFLEEGGDLSLSPRCIELEFSAPSALSHRLSSLF